MSATLHQTRVVLASLLAGAVTALLLTLVVFPGATEAVVTGSALLGFGLGWAVLAVLSTRGSGQPLRWARVPAVAMSVTGAALIVLAPQNGAMSALGWVWPLALVALVVWIWRQAGRTLNGRDRRLVTVVLAVLALAAVGGMTQDVSSLRDEPAAPGRTYAVGDHELHLDCRGHGGPTVVLFNGLGETSAAWDRVTGPVSTTTRVCAYDRAGQGWSTEADRPQDGIAAAADLHALLAAAGEPGPYVLVGHSIGGPYAMTYAEQYPADVAGMVLLDSSSPRQLSDVADYSWQYQLMRRGLALLPTLARVGLGSTQAARNGRDEVSMIPTVFEQAQALTTLGDRPLAVLTASGSLATGGWAEAQDRLAALSTNCVHREVESSHAGLVDDAHGAAASVAGVEAVVTALTSHASVPAS